MAGKADPWPKEFATPSTYAGTFTPKRSGSVDRVFGSVTSQFFRPASSQVAAPFKERRLFHLFLSFESVNKKLPSGVFCLVAI